jgi:hypothetical protein
VWEASAHGSKVCHVDMNDGAGAHYALIDNTDAAVAIGILIVGCLAGAIAPCLAYMCCTKW